MSSHIVSDGLIKHSLCCCVSSPLLSARHRHCPHHLPLPAEEARDQEQAASRVSLTDQRLASAGEGS